MNPTLQGAADVARQGSWDRGLDPWLYWVGEVGPAFLAVLCVCFLLRALARWNRYRAVGVLSPSDIQTLHDELIAAERKTRGEIVTLVVERSDAHPAAEWRAAVLALLLASALLERWLPWHAPHWLLACQLGIGAVGYAAARLLPDFKRLFILESRASEMAEEQAFQEFHRLALHETEGRTGVLLFVSLLERRVIVLGDAGIHAKVGDEHWARTKDAILSGIGRGSLCDGLIAGIRACGAVLAAHFPWESGDRNEIPDRVIIRRE